MKIKVYDRQKKMTFEEKVYGGQFLEYLYGNSVLSKWSAPLVHILVTRFACFSMIYGWLQRGAFSKKKIVPFIREYAIDETEFLESADQFSSFNAFFTRRLRPSARPIADSSLIAPADGRYLAFSRYRGLKNIFVKGQVFSLRGLLGGNLQEAEPFMRGSFLMIRLSPLDCHRFHFPVQGIPSASRRIRGRYGSVNPVSLKKNISVISENKRIVVPIETTIFGRVMMVIVGATNVGSIHLEYIPHTTYEAGVEMGYFSFGGSMLLLFFEPGAVAIDSELLYNTSRGLETYIRLGESLLQ